MIPVMSKLELTRNDVISRNEKKIDELTRAKNALNQSMKVVPDVEEVEDVVEVVFHL